MTGAGQQKKPMSLRPTLPYESARRVLSEKAGSCREGKISLPMSLALTRFGGSGTNLILLANWATGPPPAFGDGSGGSGRPILHHAGCRTGVS